MNTLSVSRLDLVTTWGRISLSACDGRLCGCALPFRDELPAGAPRITGRKLVRATASDRRVLQQAEKFVRACLCGGLPPAAPPLGLGTAGAFTARVLAQLQRIPRGQTATYGAIARRLGAPRAARAVGTACGANPLPLFIPCHRVVAAGGALGGFSAGLAWKKFLLARERAA